MLIVGDEVIINASAHDEYSYSMPGSTGTILKISDTLVQIRFNYLVYPYEADKNPVWWIDLNHVSILNKYTPQEKVCRKIKQMEERRKNVSVYI